ncbi:Aldo/keto reductase [Corchorus olitorius]|uniref:Aldo/keto reductase n=1 Tax=Corchorus olitorius TaxID=93759 RepID=A0A1R3JWM9_9ROSI|nr:Aldo/keto reductase [Corchorus olitorius]
MGDQMEIKNICDSLGIRLIAYSPLGLGMLTGKYSPSKLQAALVEESETPAGTDEEDLLTSSSSTDDDTESQEKTLVKMNGA